MQQERNTHEGYHKTFLEKLFFQCPDGPLDESAAVIHNFILQIWRQTLHCVLELSLYLQDHLPRICTVADDHDATDGLTLTVEFGDPSPHIRAKLHVGDLPKQYGNAFVADADSHLAQIVQFLYVTAHAQDKFFFR